MSEVAIGTPGARHLALSALAAGLYPPAPMSFPEWIESNIVLIDGPFAGQLYSFYNAPPLRGIAECLGDDHPCNLVTVRKSQQTGASILALAWLLFIADREPANTLYGCPGTDFLRDLNGQKLQPLIDAWQKHIKRTVIIPQTSRSGAGSTTYEKRFAGGYAALGNANAVMDFTGKTCKKGVKDEFSKWQHIPGFGDPNDLFRGRFTAFRRTKDWKHLEISTPEVDTGDETGEHAAHCRIDRSFKRSDQRFFNVLCPECRKPFVYTPSGLVLVREHAHKSRFACNKVGCGHHLSEAERVASIRGAEPAGYGWIASREGPDRHPGFHYDAFLSLMMSLEAIAEETIEAERKGTEQARKGLSTLIHGLPYRYRGDAPDHTRLMERREDDLKRRRVPAGGLLLTASADVQGRGIWFEIVAHGADRQTWLVDYGYLPGDTSFAGSKVYQDLLDATVNATFLDAFDHKRRVDAFGIDTGWESHTVYAFIRASQRVNPETGRDLILALDGRDGWSAPAIGTPSLKDIDLEGKRIKQGVQLWPVGTWPLKSNLYASLHKAGIRSGELADPPGYCHFGAWVDEGYFKQLTSERLEDIIVRGQVTGRRWAPSTDNHLLDCRVYNLALAEYLGLSSMSPDEWAALARARGLPDELSHVDLFTPTRKVSTSDEGSSGAPPAAPPPSPEPEPAPPPPPEAPGWFDRVTENWF